MTIFFRVDESNNTGSGHLVRCLTLAKEIAKYQSDIVFICAEVSIESIQKIDLGGFTLVKISDFKGEINDALEVTEVLKKFAPGVVIVDHYQLKMDWTMIISNLAHKLIVIDDLMDRPLHCDLVINPNCFMANAYDMLVPDYCELLIGPKYVMVNPEYLLHKKSITSTSIETILIFMGGSDSKGLTLALVEALSDTAFGSIHLDIVIGSHNLLRSEIEEKVNKRGNFSLYYDRPHLADLMNRADLSFGAGGNSAWERVCVGLPSFIITLSDNQLCLANYLNTMGFATYIGHHDIITTIQIQSALKEEIKYGSLRNNMSINKTICDGMGVKRVAKKISSLII